METKTADPRKLVKNPWNTNRVSPDAQAKLTASVKRLGMFKPIVVRELDDGTLQILGGEHRVDSAIEEGYARVPIFNVGQISDEKAKEISLVDNGRYGTDDALALAELLKGLELPADELASFMPYNDAELTAVFAAAEINLEGIGFDDKDDQPEAPENRPAPTHQIVRFKVHLKDAELVTTVIERTIRDQGFKGDDALTNAGDALVHILKGAA